MADGTGMKAEGWVTLPLRISGRIFVQQTFLVADSDCEVVHGMDFITKNDYILDFEMAKFSIRYYEVSSLDHNGAPYIKHVQVLAETRIRPRSEKMVEGRLNFDAAGCMGLIEPKHQIHRLRVAATIHRPAEVKLAVRLCNTRDEELVIAAGTIIGCFTPVDMVEIRAQGMKPQWARLRCYQANQMQPLEVLPPHLKETVARWCTDLEQPD